MSRLRGHKEPQGAGTRPGTRPSNPPAETVSRTLDPERLSAAASAIESGSLWQTQQRNAPMVRERDAGRMIIIQPMSPSAAHPQLLLRYATARTRARAALVRAPRASSPCAADVNNVLGGEGVNRASSCKAVGVTLLYTTVAPAGGAHRRYC